MEIIKKNDVKVLLHDYTIKKNKNEILLSNPTR